MSKKTLVPINDVNLKIFDEICEERFAQLDLESLLVSIIDNVPVDVFEVTHIALGDGNGRYYEPSTSQTKLVHEVWRGNVEKCEWTEERFYCVTTVPAEVGGFDVREAGVFDAENNLLVISKFPETIKQAPESGTVKQLTIGTYFFWY